MAGHVGGEKITGLKITQSESDYIYKMVDSNTNANVENEIKLNFLTGNYLQEKSETLCETSLSYKIPSKQWEKLQIPSKL